MTPSTFPGGLSELEFVEAYARSAVRKPQMAADAALSRLVFAEAGDRAILAGLMGQELAEACRRLVAVHAALASAAAAGRRRMEDVRPPGCDLHAGADAARTQSR